MRRRVCVARGDVSFLYREAVRVLQPIRARSAHALWYYRAVVDVLRSLPNASMTLVRELEETVATLEREARLGLPGL